MTEQVLPAGAVEAAKEAMREVTPPPGVSKADWLAEHGDFALIAGAIAAAAPHIRALALKDAAEVVYVEGEVVNAKWRAERAALEALVTGDAS